MSRKREGDGAHWGEDRLLRAAAAELVDAEDAAIDQRATDLVADPRRLMAFVIAARQSRRRS